MTSGAGNNELDIANNLSAEVATVRRNSRAFTMVEVLVVMAILAVLMTIGIVGMRSFGGRSKEKDARVTFTSLLALLKEGPHDLPTGVVEAAINHGNQEVPGAVRYGSGYWTGLNMDSNGTDRTGDAVQRTRSVLARLRAVPANRTAMDNFPSNKLWSFSLTPDPAGDPNATVPVVLDAWNNPIIFVPAAGLVIRDPKNNAIVKTIVAPNNRPFFASAGADGAFQGIPEEADVATRIERILAGAEDNIYSFDN
jgi:prepilin-type N-terminal cleavage/methylation domain-containing protein